MSKDVPSPLRRLFGKLSARRRLQLFLVLGLMLVGAVAEVMALGAVLPFLALVADPSRAAHFPTLGALFEVLGWRRPDDLLIPATILFAAVALAAAVVRIFLSWASTRFVYSIGYDLGSQIYWRMLHQPYPYHLSRNTSEVVAAIGMVQTVISGVLLPLMQSVIAVIIGLFVVAALVAVDPVVSMGAFLCFGVLYAGIAFLAQRRLRANGKIIASTATRRIQAVQEGLGGIRDVLIDNTQAVFLRKFATLDHALRTAQAANTFIGAAPRFAIEAVGMSLIAVLALYMSTQPGGLAAALPILGAQALGAQRLLPLMQLVYTGRTQLQGNWHVLLHVLDLLDAPMPEEYLPQTSREDVQFTRSIALRRVSFRYQPDQEPVLKNLSLTIRKGSKVGFIGKTGSGKSTTIDLIMGLLEPTTGSVSIDGQALEARTRRGWQFQIAHVPQVIFLSDSTIAENIAFGVAREKIDMGRVWEAARKSALADFIEAMPESYQTIVGERGVRLSGGQRQRIGIARALYKQASVLIFDEATSALDNETESAVMEAIAALGSELTVILIAHRLSTVAVCDEVFRLEGGQVADRGDYESVVLKAPTG